jgi:hypothetical protein
VCLKAGRDGILRPVKLKASIADDAYEEVHPCIEAREKYLVFGSGRPGGFGKCDLWVIFSGDNGTWSEPINLGGRINTRESEGFPSLSPDGRFLFFERSQNIYWVSTETIHALMDHKTKEK